jgi:hypothetical protein
MDDPSASSAIAPGDLSLVAAPAANSLVVRHPPPAMTELVAGLHIGAPTAAPQLVISTTKVKRSHAALSAVASTSVCPLCRTPLTNTPPDFSEVPKGTNTAYFKLLHSIPLSIGASVSTRTDFHIDMQGAATNGAAEIFQSSSGGHQRDATGSDSSVPVVAESSDVHFSGLNNGYYRRFFVEVQRIGAGSFGLVCLCRHVLEGIHLGDFAVKIVGVGNDRKWLAKAMQEKGEKPRPVVIIAALKKQGIAVSSPQVSMVLKRMGLRPVRGRKAGTVAARGGAISVDDLLAAKELVSRFGGTARALAALHALQKFES